MGTSLVLFLQAGLLIWVFVTVVWLYSLTIRDASVMDVFWGPGFITVSMLYVIGVEGVTVREGLVLALVMVWGTRLALHIGVRNHGQPEDARYKEWRRTGGVSWWWKSYIKVFLLQGVVMWMVSLALLYPLTMPHPVGLNILDWLGLALWITGFLFQAISDYQLVKFKRDSANSGALYTGGLWSHSRHPNYFGESLIWWGLAMFALASGAWAGMIAPLLMTFLLLKVSGVTLLEKTMAVKKPGMDKYRDSTPAFVPWKLVSGRWRMPLFLLITVPCAILAGLQILYGAPPDNIKELLVRNIELEKFAGNWFVVAGKTTYLEREAVNAVESYRLLPDGSVGIEYTFRRGSAVGEPVAMSGIGKPQLGTGNAYWTVQFAGPLKFSYFVVDLAEDYSYAVVASSGGGHLWILSRVSALKPAQYQRIMLRLAELSYDTDSIRQLPQQWDESGQSTPPAGRPIA